MEDTRRQKVFISYCWSSEEYIERVLKLAERLMSDGVDVILDRWDLQVGQDVYSFMEKSISEADKVLILCDERYVEKADCRVGGVGTETLIITGKLYGNSSPEKFIPVVMNSALARPIYLKDRYFLTYISGSEAEYRGLIRAIFDVKFNKPAIGLLKGDLASVIVHDANSLSGKTELDLRGTEIRDINFLSKLTHIASLDLSANSMLTDISVLSYLTNLTNLKLSGTGVTDISPLLRLTNLTSLDLSWNSNIRDISALSNHKYLNNLDLMGTEIDDIGPLSGLVGLINLNLSNNKTLSEISALSGLTSLNSLSLRNTGVRDISALSGLTSLNSLDLSDTGVRDISALSGLTSLNNLDLSGTGVRDISALSNLVALTKLNLSGVWAGDNNHTGSISDISVLKGLKALTYLDLHKTNIEDISSLSGLTNLKKLELQETRVSDISVITNLVNLSSLDLQATKVGDISPLIALENLTSLNLSFNSNIIDISALANLKSIINLDLQWTEIFDISVLSGMLSLEKLNLRGTKVDDIAPLSKLKGIKNLDLRNMKLTSIPEELLNLGLEFITDEFPKGQGIYIYALELIKQSISIFHQSRELIEEYYRNLKTSNAQMAPINECKVVFLGDGGAGKSLIIDRLMNDGNKSLKFEGESTPGINISQKTFQIGEEEITLHFWDFGGEAMLHSMHRMFLTNRTLYVVVTNARGNDVTDRARYWIRNIRSFTNAKHGSVRVILLVNHRDENPCVDVNGYSLKKEYNGLMDIRIVSALEDSREVFNDTIRNVICDTVSGMESVHTLLPKSWISLMNDLQEMQDDCITSNEFYLKCNCHEMEIDEELLNEIIGWYQDLGVCFYSRENPFSEQYIVLKPRWILNALYILNFNGRLRAKNGVITEKNIYSLICGNKKSKKSVRDENSKCLANNRDSVEIIKKVNYDIEYGANDIQYIIRVLRAHQLLYQLNDDVEERYFVPMLCNENIPETILRFDTTKALHISFHYDFLPDNILHRLMIRHGHELDTDAVCKTAAIFTGEDWSTLVRSKESILDVYVKSDSQDEDTLKVYLEMLRMSIREINKEFGIYAEEYIAYRIEEKEDYFKYKALKGGERKGLNFIYSEEFDCLISIADILGTVTMMSDKTTQGVIEHICTALVEMEEEPSNFENQNETMITSALQRSISQILNKEYGIQIAREYTLGRAKKSIGETDLYFYRYEGGIKQEFYVLENKVLENFRTEQYNQYKQLMGYLNKNFKAGITLSINRKKGWEDAFDFIQDKLEALQSERGEFAPMTIKRIKKINKTHYLRTEHVVPETGRTMPVYHLVLHLSGESRQRAAKEARRKTQKP